VIFDMDGVLLDSEPLHHHAANTVLLEDGHPPLSLAEYTPYLGTTDEDMWRDLRARRGLGRPHEHYLTRFDNHVLAAYRQHAIAAPGVVDLLDWLTACGLPLAVASSSRAQWIETCLDAIGIRRYFDRIVGGDMVARGKPDPEIFLVAARQLRAQPARCVVFEDSPVGVTAASRAGMYTIAVCTPYTPPGLAQGAHFTVNSLTEVSRALRGRTIARAARPGTSGERGRGRADRQRPPSARRLDADHRRTSSPASGPAPKGTGRDDRPPVPRSDLRVHRTEGGSLSGTAVDAAQHGGQDLGHRR
jgi:HAD superfamily hydrolase (TIGR01509 family)